VAAGERLLTLTTSNALVNYVSALCRSTVISCALERAVPPDLTSGTTVPCRFTLVLGVLGVLTARVAIVRSRDKTAEASAVQRLGPQSLQEASTAMKPMTPVGAELGGTTPRGQPGASEGADVVMGEGGDGATVAAGGVKASKSQGMASWRIEALSIGSVTEHLAPYQQSSTAVFRAINEEAYAALHLLRRKAAASKEPPQVDPSRPRAAAAAAPSGARGGVWGRHARSALGPAAAEKGSNDARALPRPRQVLSALVAWLANYRSLFSARCHVCRRVRRSRPPCPRPALQAAPGQCNADDAAAEPQILVAEEAIPSGHATTFGTAGSERAGEAGSTVHPFSSVHFILLRARRNTRRRFHAPRCSSAHRKYSHSSEPYRPPSAHNVT
jgi:hypothetical protein